MLTTYTKIITCETPAGKISSREVGGKAFNLFKLRSFGFPVPRTEPASGTAGLPLGTFLVQQCIPEEDSIQKYYSRVRIA